MIFVVEHHKVIDVEHFDLLDYAQVFARREVVEEEVAVFLGELEDHVGLRAIDVRLLVLHVDHVHVIVHEEDVVLVPEPESGDPVRHGLLGVELVGVLFDSIHLIVFEDFELVFEGVFKGNVDVKHVPSE